jgi:hypothetical protein
MLFSDTPAAREARLRRLAKRQDLMLRKSRWRLGSIDNLGGYQIIEPNRNLIILGSRYELDLDDVQDFLTESD